MVPGENGSIPEHREVTGTPRELYGPYWALVGERGKEQRRGVPPKPNPNWRGAVPLSFSPNPTREGGGILLPVGVGLPLGRA